MEEQEPTSTEAGAAFVVTHPVSWRVAKYRPVVAHIVGGGTSAVLPSAARNQALPEGAILVSNLEQGTVTGIW